MIYLDNAATTKPNKRAIEQATPYIFDEFFNPSAGYSEAIAVSKAINNARENILSYICTPLNYSLVFTSCGTESNNQILQSFSKRGNIVTTKGEHSAIFEKTKQLSRDNNIEVRYAGLNSNGSVNENDLLSLIDEKTVLVSVIHVNNETGAVNDISALSKKIKSINPKTVFHSDGVQAFGKIPFRIPQSIDAYSVSAHKIGALKGVGCLIFKKDLPIKEFVIGGGQQGHLRSGTENVFGIKVFEFAAKDKYENIEKNYEFVSKLNRLMIESLDNERIEIISTGSCSPYILSISAKGCKGEVLKNSLSVDGLLLSNGSACSTKLGTSHVLANCNLSQELVEGVIRVSFSPENTEQEIIEASNMLNCAVTQLSKIFNK